MELTIQELFKYESNQLLNTIENNLPYMEGVPNFKDYLVEKFGVVKVLYESLNPNQECEQLMYNVRTSMINL